MFSSNHPPRVNFKPRLVQRVCRCKCTYPRGGETCRNNGANGESEDGSHHLRAMRYMRCQLRYCHLSWDHFNKTVCKKSIACLPCKKSATTAPRQKMDTTRPGFVLHDAAKTDRSRRRRLMQTMGAQDIVIFYNCTCGGIGIVIFQLPSRQPRQLRMHLNEAGKHCPLLESFQRM